VFVVVEQLNASGAAGSGASASAVSPATTVGNAEAAASFGLGNGVAVAVGVPPPTGRENMSPGGFDNAPPVGLIFSDGNFENVIVGGFGKEDPGVVDGTAPLIVLVLPVNAGGGANVVVADPGGLGNGDAGITVVVVPDGRENRLEASCLGVAGLGDGLAVAIAAGSAVALPNEATGGGGNIKLFGSPPEPGDGAAGEVNLLAANDVATAGLGDMYGCGGGGVLCTP
jgi:hypothetical protein